MTCEQESQNRRKMRHFFASKKRDECPLEATRPREAPEGARILALTVAALVRAAIPAAGAWAAHSTSWYPGSQARDLIRPVVRERRRWKLVGAIPRLLPSRAFEVRAGIAYSRTAGS